MKHFKSRFLLVLAVMIAMLSSITAFAKDNGGIAPHWSYLMMISGNLEVDDYNSARVSVAATSDPSDTDSLKIVTRLQQYDGGWKNYETWTDNVSDPDALLEYYTAIPKGYSYRVRVTVSTYKNGKLLESATENFNYGYYPK